MIIKSHIRGGYRSAADYLKSQGENEVIRTVEISDPDAKTLDQAFHNMWTISCNSRAKKPLHHISINPFKDERLTDKEVLKIVKRCEEKYGYKPECHQRVIVEHIKDGRQHFHVMWNRVGLDTGKAVWPGHHWKKSKQAAREMESELGLKRPTPRRYKPRPPIYYGGIDSLYRRYGLPSLRSRLMYALLSEAMPDAPEYTGQKKTKSGKGEKGGDGAGGGPASTTSALKTTRKASGEKKSAGKMKTSEPSRPGSGPERRRQKMWVPVERRGPS
jgi:hypothetical protein